MPFGHTQPHAHAHTQARMHTHTHSHTHMHAATHSATLERGQKQLTDMLAKLGGSNGTVLAGPDAFLLYDSFGFPLELTQEMAEQQGIQVTFPACS